MKSIDLSDEDVEVQELWVTAFALADYLQTADEALRRLIALGVWGTVEHLTSISVYSHQWSGLVELIGVMKRVCRRARGVEVRRLAAKVLAVLQSSQETWLGSTARTSSNS